MKEQRTKGPREQGPARGGWLVGPAFVLLAAALAVVPQVVRGTSCGHDFDFHLVSWIDALDSWRHGILYPHWAATPNYNAGEPRFVFYPPLTWMLGAALGAVLPWIWVPVAMTFLLLAGTGLATRALARQMLPDGGTTLAGCIAVFSGYTLYTVYERSAFAELAGGIWIPLLLLLVLRGESAGAGLRRVVAQVVDRSALLLALVIAAAWLSNAPVGVMACYLLGAMALAAALLRRSWQPIVRAVAGAALGMGLAAFYLVPAAIEQKWVDIRQVTGDPGEQIQNSFLFGHHADPELALHDAELYRVSWIAVAMLAAILVGIAVRGRRRALAEARQWWVPLALIPVGVLFLLLPISLPVWNLLPKMRFLQFPWRWLVSLEAPLGIFVAWAVWAPQRARRNLLVAACVVLFVGLTVFAGRRFFEVCDQYDAVPGMLEDYRAGAGFQGTDEYAPMGADNSLVAGNLPAACLVSNAGAALGKTSADNPQPSWGADQKSCLAVLPKVEAADAKHWSARGEVPKGGYLVLRLRRCPAWDVRVNGRQIADPGRREDGLMVVPVAAGPVDVRADWRATPDVWRGRWISLISLVLMAGIGTMGLMHRRGGAHRLG
jgi:6-pyruvoyl-tetrahydropterin synthase related domain